MRLQLFILMIILMILAACVVNVGLNREAFFDGLVSVGGSRWVQHESSCGPVSSPIPVYHNHHVAFLTRYHWCEGDLMLATQVTYPRNQLPTQPGDVIRCDFDLSPVEPSQLSFTPR